MKIIPFHKPAFGHEEIRAVTETLKSGWITTGPITRTFEQKFSAFVGARYAVALNSGTAALHLALEAAGVRAGDEVITVPFTFVATSEAILYCGARPIYVDCDPVTFNMQPDQIEKKITRRTRAILPVHFGGQACDMEPILEIARRRKIKIIEDAAHAFPAKYKGHYVGNLGDFTCFSFYATKTLSTGEGGMLTTNDRAAAERVRLLSLHGIDKASWERRRRGDWRYQVVALGHKYNLGDLSSAIGLAQLAKAQKYLEKRRSIASAYNQAFEDFDLLDRPTVLKFNEHAWHLYAIRLRLDKLKINRDGFMQAMKAAGIDVSVHFIPLYEHPYYQKHTKLKAANFPGVQKFCARIVSLPIYPGMSQIEVRYVSEIVRRILEKNRKRR